MWSTLFELLSLWFLGSFLENFRGSNWVMSLYAVSVLGTAITAAVIYDLADKLGHPMEQLPIYGCMGGIFGLLIAIGVLYGDTEFLMFFLISIKARYLAAIYALIAMRHSSARTASTPSLKLGGALAGLLSSVSPRAVASDSWPASGCSASATTTIAGNAAAPDASSRSTCASRAAMSASTTATAPSKTIPNDPQPLELVRRHPLRGRSQVPHPQRVFVFALRVGYRGCQQGLWGECFHSQPAPEFQRCRAMTPQTQGADIFEIALPPPSATGTM